MTEDRRMIKNLSNKRISNSVDQKEIQQKRIENWQRITNDFLNKVKNSVENISSTQNRITPRHKGNSSRIVAESLKSRVTEFDGSSYTIAGLLFSRNGKLVSLEPVSSKTIGFGGRIDVLMPNGTRAFSIVRKGRTWIKMNPVKEIPSLLTPDESGKLTLDILSEDILKCLK